MVNFSKVKVLAVVTLALSAPNTVFYLPMLKYYVHFMD